MTQPEICSPQQTITNNEKYESILKKLKESHKENIKQHNEIQQLKERLSMYESCIEQRSLKNSKILHMKKNPLQYSLQSEVATKEAIIETLQKQLDTYKYKSNVSNDINTIHSNDEGEYTTRSPSISSIEKNKNEIIKLKKQNIELEELVSELTRFFKKKTNEYRNVIETVLGYKVDVHPAYYVLRLSNISKSLSIQPIVFIDKTNLNIQHNEFFSSLPLSIRNLENSLPLFFASLCLFLLRG